MPQPWRSEISRAQAVHAVVVAAHAHERRPVDGGCRRAWPPRGLRAPARPRAGPPPPRPRPPRWRGCPSTRSRRCPCRTPSPCVSATATRRSLNESVGMAGGVVLDPEVGDAEARAQPRRGQERREAGAVPDGRLAVDGQQLTVAPEVARPGGDRLARERRPHAVQVVDGLEARPSTPRRPPPAPWRAPCRTPCTAARSPGSSHRPRHPSLQHEPSVAAGTSVALACA